MNFGAVLYESKERVATITLNRPERFNAISETMPEDIAAAFGHANNDDTVHVVVLTGAGRGFCGGCDLKAFAEKSGINPAIQDMPWDPMIDYNFMSRCTQSFMSIWRCHKPVIARVHGDAVAGGSDIALCCDIIIMNEDARIGYPPSRVWGCPTTAMWVYRLGAEKAKQSQPFSMAWPGIVPKVSGLSNARRKSALNRLLPNVTREIRYRAVKNEFNMQTK